MVSLTKNERKALIILFKELSSYHNANSLSKNLGISRVGTMKMLKKLHKEELLIDKKIGKSIVYKLNLNYDYAIDLISFLLSDEANNFKRWKDEFKGLFKKERVVMFYGSAIRDYAKARDIDIMIIRGKKESGEVYKVIAERQKFIPKKIHVIDLTPEEFVKNLRQKKKAIMDIVKNAVILYGQNRYVGLIKNVTSI